MKKQKKKKQLKYVDVPTEVTFVIKKRRHAGFVVGYIGDHSDEKSKRSGTKKCKDSDSRRSSRS